MMDELVLLIDRVTASENLYQRLEAFYAAKHHEWSPTVASYFKDMLQRKLDQIDYEWHRVHQMGRAVASGRSEQRVDI